LQNIEQVETRKIIRQKKLKKDCEKKDKKEKIKKLNKSTSNKKKKKKKINEKLEKEKNVGKKHAQFINSYKKTNLLSIFDTSFLKKNISRAIKSFNHLVKNYSCDLVVIASPDQTQLNHNYSF
jgi:hypothetical protein